MRRLIIYYLRKCGFSNIKWLKGRKGWYILACKDNATICIDLRQIVNEILDKELSDIETDE